MSYEGTGYYDQYTGELTERAETPYREQATEECWIKHDDDWKSTFPELFSEEITREQIRAKFEAAGNDFHSMTGNKYYTPEVSDTAYNKAYSEYYRDPIIEWIYNLVNKK